MKKKKIKAKLDKTKKKLSKMESRLEEVTKELKSARKALVAEGIQANDGIPKPAGTVNGTASPGDVVH